MRIRRLVFVSIGILLGFVQFANVFAESIGVYYFPGWRSTVARDTWKPIREHGGLEPLLGWYEISDSNVVDRQLQWMNQYGLSFVVFDWYAEQKMAGSYVNPAIDGYLKSSSKGALKFAILWANNGADPATLAEFDAMVQWWTKKYLRNGSYFQVNGNPVVFIFEPDTLASTASKWGLSTKYLLERARNIARMNGVNGIYFVASTHAIADKVNQTLPAAGFDALSAYNYHFGLSGEYVKRRGSHSYSELSEGYSETWNWMVRNSRLPYFLPLTAGWDRRPWGGSKDPLHDESISDPDSFEAHLREGAALMEEFPRQTKGVAVICCWNEFGEGSVIEPTTKYNFSYLEKIRSVFGRQIKDR